MLAIKSSILVVVLLGVAVEPAMATDHDVVSFVQRQDQTVTGEDYTFVFDSVGSFEGAVMVSMWVAGKFIPGQSQYFEFEIDDFAHPRFWGAYVEDIVIKEYSANCRLLRLDWMIGASNANQMVMDGQVVVRVNLGSAVSVSACDPAFAQVELANARCAGQPVTIMGTSGNDLLKGSSNADVIHGWTGNDVIAGKDENDILCGGDGNDTIGGSAGDDWMFGNAGHDVLYGGDGIDTMEGNGGADVLYGGRGGDILLGGNSRDLLYGGDGDDDLDGQAGLDMCDGGTADEVLGDMATADCETVKEVP